MSFRGVLLRLADGAGAFRVLAPDAALRLPQEAAPAAAEPRVAASDAATGQLLGVARLSAVSARAALRSALWVSPGGGAAERQCLCFYFRSDVEFELFARAADAFRNAQRYSLLHHSVLLELQAQREMELTSRAALQAAAAAAVRALANRKSTPKNGSQPADVKLEKPAAIKQETPRAVGKTAAANSKKANNASPRYSRAELDAISGTPRNGSTARDSAAGRDESAPQTCVLCRFQSTPATGAEQFKIHPFVLKDGRDHEIHICKICLQKVLQRRMLAAKDSSPCCNLCSEPTSQPKGKVKQCAHEMCKKLYCAPCIDRIMGKAQAHKVWRTKRWFCPNCTEDEASGLIQKSEKSSRGNQAPAKRVVADDASRSKKKRKRIEDDSSDSNSAAVAQSALTTVLPKDMTPLDYFAPYYQFVVTREEANPPEEESEDVCFCCKDGGDVIECDWKGLAGNFARCPKVYHEDCLGYSVPEEKEWLCPRHRCFQCGIIAQFSCRFCVTSFCENHLPEEALRMGHGTPDIPTSTYVICPTCNKHAADAVAQKKLPQDFYDRVFCAQ